MPAPFFSRVLLQFVVLRQPEDHIRRRYWALVCAMGGICRASGCMAFGIGFGAPEVVALPVVVFGLVVVGFAFGNVVTGGICMAFGRTVPGVCMAFGRTS